MIFYYLIFFFYNQGCNVVNKVNTTNIMGKNKGLQSNTYLRTVFAYNYI